MAGIDPYSPCPCGSGEKFKWCCQKVESFVEKADRLYDGGQTQAALDAIGEGLRKHPDNALLSLRKAAYELRERREKDAADTLRAFLRTQPNHLPARVVLARAVLETEGPASASAHVQNALGLADGDDRDRLANIYYMVGYVFARIGQTQAALKHFEQANALDTSPEGSDATSRMDLTRRIASSPTVSPYLKFPYRLSPTPAGLSEELGNRFDEAYAWAEAGAWNTAAAAFESLSSEISGPEADRNLALLRLWTGDERGAALALRRAIPKLGQSIEAVDLEALYQLIQPTSPAEKVDQVQLIWPLKNRDALLDKLRAQPDVVDDGPGPIDPSDEKSPEVQHFFLLDRPPLKPSSGADLKASDMPRVVASAFVGKEIAGIETFDDGNLNLLIDRFTALAVPAIPPAHPKTKIIGESHRSQLAMSWDWHYPEGIEPGPMERLRDEEQARLIRETWPKTKLHFLGNRTPLEAAKAGDAVVPLRAAVSLYELVASGSVVDFDFPGLRARLNIPAEPEIDPTAVDLSTLNYARYHSVPVDRLSDDQLLDYYRVSRENALRKPAEQAARRLADRPELRKRAGFSPLQIFGDLASMAALVGKRQEAIDWLTRGRNAEEQPKDLASQASWDMFEIRTLAQVDRPESWVPELAAVLERYNSAPEAGQALLLGLMGMGLVQAVPNPDQPEQVLVDTRPLQMLMSQFGPRITTASGRLGVSATKGEVWTPDSAKSGTTSPGGIWTPGSSSAGPTTPGGDKPKLIIPGR